MTNEQAAFAALVTAASPTDRKLAVDLGAFRPDARTVYVRFHNAMPDVYDRTALENSKTILTVSGDFSAKVKVELSVPYFDSAGRKHLKLRAKTGTPAAIAAYIGAHLTEIATSYAPKTRADQY